MSKMTVEDVLARLMARDPRYELEAYAFVRDALEFTVRTLDQSRHVSGQELLGGIRKYALAEYGPMARTLLGCWGIHQCEDFGEIVFNLVENGLLGKTDDDEKDDFSGGYDFEDAFVKPYWPQARLAGND